MSKSELAYQVASFKFGEQRLRSGEIAEKMKLSRSRVSRLLRKAEEMGIVTHKVMPPQDKSWSEKNSLLEEQLMNSFSLKQAVVVKAGDYEPSSVDTLHDRIGKAAVEVFLQTARGAGTIGIGGGRMVHSLIRELPADTRFILPYPLTTISLQAGTELSQNSDVSANAAAAMLARLSYDGLMLYPAGVIGYLKPIYGQRWLLKSEETRLALAIAGITNRFPGFSSELDYYTQADIRTLEQLADNLSHHYNELAQKPAGLEKVRYHPVGWLLNRPFVVQHEVIMGEVSEETQIRLTQLADNLSKRAVAVSEEQLQKTKRVMILAGGEGMAFPLWHVLTQILKTRENQNRHLLVTDDQTAQDLLKIASL